MIEYKEDDDFIIITDKPVNLITIIAGLIIIDITFFFLDNFTLLTTFIFAIPLGVAYLFLKKTTTTISKETLDATIESQYFFNTSIYQFNLKNAKLEIAFVSKLFKGNGVLLVNGEHPISTPDVSRPYPKDIGTVLQRLKELKNSE